MTAEKRRGLSAAASTAWESWLRTFPAPPPWPRPGSFMLVAAAAVVWRRTAAWGAATLTIYYALIVFSPSRPIALSETPLLANILIPNTVLWFRE